MTHLDLFTFTYPKTAGFKRHGTSKDAAQSITPKLPLLRDKVLAALSLRPMTADECAAHIGVTPFSARPRLSELLALNLIEPTGTRRTNTSGRMADVYRVKT